jgi:hypothetical protein
VYEMLINKLKHKLNDILWENWNEIDLYI